MLLDLGPGRIAAMDEAGIDLQVLSAAPIGVDRLGEDTATSLAADTNDRLVTAIAARPDRFGLLRMKNPETAVLGGTAGAHSWTPLTSCRCSGWRCGPACRSTYIPPRRWRRSWTPVTPAYRATSARCCRWAAGGGMPRPACTRRG